MRRYDSAPVTSDPIMTPPSAASIDAKTTRRRRIGLALFLAATCVLLALSRQIIFACFRSDIDPRWNDFFFANQVGLVHAQLLMIAAVSFGASRPTSLWMIAGGVLTVLFIIFLARAGFLYNIYDSTQSMAIRASTFFLIARWLATNFHPRDASSSPAPLHFSIVDGLMLTLVLATFLWAMRDVLDRYPKLWRDDLLIANRDYASLVFYLTEAFVESVVGFTWVELLRQKRRWTFSVPLLVLSTLIGSVICTLAFKVYEWYQFEYPVQLRVVTDFFQIAFPKMMAFAAWCLLFGVVLRRVGLLGHREIVTRNAEI